MSASKPRFWNGRVVTPRQREVLDHLTEHGAFSSAAAHMVHGTDSTVADKLATSGVINKRYAAERGDVYWIRAEGETATGNHILVGFVVILRRNVTTPRGRTENFFLARAPWDGKATTSRKLLRGWMKILKLQNKDLSGGTMGFEAIPADSAVFNGDHLILQQEITP